MTNSTHAVTPRSLAEPAAASEARLPGLPHVTVVLPVRNEAGHIEDCIERLIGQQYPLDLMEIIVVDGGSRDGTVDAVRKVMANHPTVALRILDNPSGIVPVALNIGIRSAKSDIIVRIDGHSVPELDYVSACVAALERSGAGNVGGVITAIGTTRFGRAVAAATGHRLGAGDARYRIGGRAGDVDTVPFGAFRKDVFQRVGLFDESLVRNQDYEMNVRIRKAGARVHFDPAIRVVYKPRGTVRGLVSQYFQYGWWRVETLRRHPRSLRWRQIIPPLVAVAPLVAIAMATWSPGAALGAAVLVVAYVATVAVVAWRVASTHASPVLVAIAFPLMHFAYGFGFLLNAVSGGRFPYRARAPYVPPLEAAPTSQGVVRA